MKFLLISMSLTFFIFSCASGDKNPSNNESDNISKSSDDVSASISTTSETPKTMNTPDTSEIPRPKKVEIAKIKTRFGDILIWLYDETPKHKANFLKLAKEGFYDSTTFHRVIPNFMIQGGDPNSKDDNPNNDGQGGPGYTIPAEIKPDLKHHYGAVAAARLSDAVNPKRESSGSQFYIVQNKNGTPHLNGSYTVFGTVISGMDVVEKIAHQPTDARDRPKNDITMDVDVVEMKVKDLEKNYNFTPPGS